MVFQLKNYFLTFRLSLCATFSVKVAFLIVFTPMTIAIDAKNGMLANQNFSETTSKIQKTMSQKLKFTLKGEKMLLICKIFNDKVYLMLEALIGRGKTMCTWICNKIWKCCIADKIKPLKTQFTFLQPMWKAWPKPDNTRSKEICTFQIKLCCISDLIHHGYNNWNPFY